MDSFISTTFTIISVPSLTTFYKHVRRYGCILTDHKLITNLHAESILTILYSKTIYQVTLVDGSVIGLYDLTNKTEYRRI